MIHSPLCDNQQNAHKQEKCLTDLQRCPSLGLNNDPTTSRTYLNDQHVCYHQAKVWQVPLDHQKEYCLGKNFERCPIFLFAEPEIPPEQEAEPPAKKIARQPIKLTYPFSLAQSITLFMGLAMVAITVWTLFSAPPPLPGTTPLVNRSSVDHPE